METKLNSMDIVSLKDGIDWIFKNLDDDQLNKKFIRDV